MSNFNKVVTNIPVSLTETEMSNLSQTFSGIIQGGGGGGEGKRYIGDGVYVTVNNDANPGVISLTQTSLDKLNKEIPSAVSSFPDSVQYAKKTYVDSTFQTKDAMSAYAKKTDLPDSITDFADTDEVIYSYLYPLTADIQSQINAKQNKLQFDLNAKGEISAIGLLNNTTTAIAGANGITGDYYSASNPSGFINSTQAETQILEKNYITSGVSELDNFYSKTNTSSKTELQTKFDSLLDYNVTAAAGIEVTTATDVGIKTFGISMTAQPVVTDTRLSGYNGIAAEPDGNVSGLWDVGLTQDMLNTINGKLDSTVAAQTYQPKGDYVSSTDITDMATKTWVGDQGFYTKASGDNDYAPKTVTATVNTLTGASAGWNEVTAKLDKSIYTNASGNWEASYNVVNQYSAAGTWLTAHQPLTNYYTKSDTSSKNELSTEFAKYVTSSNVTTQDTDYVMTTTGWKVLTLPGGGMTQVIHDETLTGQGNANDNKLGVAWSALSGNTIASANSAYFATKAKYGDQREYEIGSEIYGLTYFRTSIINWTNLITGNSGIDVLDLDDDGYPEIFQLTQTAYNAVTSVSSKLDTTAAAQTYLTTATYSVDSATFLTKSSADNDYAPISISATVNTLTAASAGWNDKVDKPTSLNDKYLVLRTDNAGNVSGWCDFQDQSYSKSEALGTFVATANIDTTTLSGDGKSVSTKLGVKTDVIATRDYVSGNYLPTSGGTVSGQLVVSGGSNFDTQFLKIIRENVNGHARLGLGQYGALALKADDSNSHTTQINVSPNTTNDQLVQVQHNGNTVGYLIPAVTATTTDGLTNDGILHIILES